MLASALLVLMSLSGCVHLDIYEHAPTVALEQTLTTATVAAHPGPRVDGIVIAPHFQEFSPDYLPNRSSVRFYATTPSSIWVSSATLGSSSGVTVTIQVDQAVEVSETLMHDPGVHWGALGLFDPSNLDFSVMRAQPDLTLHLTVRGADGVETIFSFPITHREEYDILWPT